MSKIEKANKILTLDLKFIDAELEKSYSLHLSQMQILYLKSFLLSSLFFSIYVWLINPLEKILENVTALTFHIINILFLVSFSLKVFRSEAFKYPQHSMVFLQLYLSVGHIEVGRMSSLPASNSPFLMTNLLLIEALMLLPLLSRCHWKLNSLSAAGLNIYLHFRLISIKDDLTLKAYAGSVFLFNIVMISYASYVSEKIDRLQFFQSKSNETLLSKFQHLIKNVLPVSILIYNKSRVVFFNKETKKLLGIGFRCSVDEQFRKIFLKEKRQDLQSIKLLSNLDNTTGKSSEKTLDRITLLDFLLKNQNNENFFDCGFECYLAHFSDKERSGFEEKYLNIKIFSLCWEGVDSLMITITEDLSYQRMQLLTEQAKYKDKILATLSHNLQTPMNGLLGILEILQETTDYSALKKGLLLTFRSSKILYYTISDIIDMTQITNNSLTLRPTVFSVLDCVKEVVKLIKFQAKKKGLCFHFSNNFQSEPLYFRTDCRRLQQVLHNLLSNALKFTQRGFIKIQIEAFDAGEGTSSPSAIKFLVEDSGCGIKPEDRESLFRLFGQLEARAQDKGNLTGIGLGLTISQLLLSRMNFQNNESSEEVIFVESKVGVGSVFSFVLKPMPAAEEDLADSMQFSQQEFEEGGKELDIRLFASSVKNQKKVLVVDDDQINLLVYSHYFKSFPEFACDVAANGQQAVDLFQDTIQSKSFYDIILMDCNMPVMNGFEATAIILQLISSNQIPEVPVVAVTANASPQNFEKCRQAGMVEFLSKPVSKSQLKETIDKVLMKASKKA